MPNIKTYDAPQLGLNPSEIGVESFAAAGRRGGAFFNQGAESIDQAGRRMAASAHELGQGVREIGSAIKEAGDVAVDYLDHQQISAGAKHEADLLSSLTDDWNQTASGSDPNDPSVARKWTEESLEPRLQQFQQGFSTQRSQQWAEHRVEQIRQHFYEKSTADMSTMAGVAAKNNVADVSTRYSNLAVRDPSAVDFLLKSVDESVGHIVDSSPNIKGSDATRLKQTIADDMKRKIANDGAFGAIQSAADPEAEAQRWIRKFPDLINGDHAIALGKAAKVQAKTNDLQERQADLYARQQQDHAVEAQRNKIWQDNVTINPQTNRPEIKPGFFQDAIKLPTQYPGAPNATSTARTLLDWGEAQMKPGAIQTDQAVMDDLNGRMFAENNQTTTIQLLRAEADHKVSHADATVLRQLIEQRDKEPPTNQMFKFAMEGAKQLIQDKNDPAQMAKFPAFQQQFLAEYQKQFRAGTLPPNALDLNDKNSMVSQMIRQYQSPLSRAIAGSGGVGSTAPSKPVTAQSSLPPLADRVKGQVYSTPRGRMEWTGRGWVPPGTAQPVNAPGPGQM